MRHITRITPSLLVAAALAVSGCGDDDKEATAPAAATATAAAAQAVQSMDGFLISASETEVLIRDPAGTEQSFAVKPEDLQSVGIGHLASHAGLTDIGFRIYYETEGETRYIKGSEEIPPPQ